MSTDEADTDPGAGRTITIIDVYNVAKTAADESSRANARLTTLESKVDTAIRPVQFPHVPLWAIAVALFALGVAQCVR